MVILQFPLVSSVFTLGGSGSPWPFCGLATNLHIIDLNARKKDAFLLLLMVRLAVVFVFPRLLTASQVYKPASPSVDFLINSSDIFPLWKVT